MWVGDGRSVTGVHRSVIIEHENVTEGMEVQRVGKEM